METHFYKVHFFGGGYVRVSFYKYKLKKSKYKQKGKSKKSRSDLDDTIPGNFFRFPIVRG